MERSNATVQTVYTKRVQLDCVKCGEDRLLLSRIPMAVADLGVFQSHV